MGIGRFLVWVTLLSIGSPDLAKGQANPPSAALHLDDVQITGERIRLSFRALDGLGQVAELDAKQLVVRQDGVPIPADRIELLHWGDLGEHIALALVLDPALASDRDTRPWVDTALAQLASALSDGDRVALVSPGDESSSPTFTSAKELANAASLVEAPDRAHGGTAIRDAIYRAASALRDSADLPHRKVVIAISAGPDFGSAHSVDDVVAAALGKPDGSRPFIPIYAIAHAPAKGEDLADLERLSRDTDGDLFLFESPVHLPSLLVAAAHPLEAAMVAIVRPELDGDAHEIELAWNDQTASVKLTYPRGSLLVRLGIALLPLLGLGWAAAIWIGRRGRHGRLVFIQGPAPGRAISLRPGSLRIGAMSQNDIVIDSDVASRHHAELRISADAVEIEDLDSENGTLVNDEPIQVRKLEPGDRIRIGDTEMVYKK